MNTLRKYLSLTYIKAHLAVVGGALASYMAAFPAGPDYKYVAFGVVALTGIGVAAIPNAETEAVLTDVAAVVHRSADPASRAN